LKARRPRRAVQCHLAALAIHGGTLERLLASKARQHSMLMSRLRSSRASGIMPTTIPPHRLRHRAASGQMHLRRPTSSTIPSPHRRQRSHERIHSRWRRSSTRRQTAKRRWSGLATSQHSGLSHLRLGRHGRILWKPHLTETARTSHGIQMMPTSFLRTCQSKITPPQASLLGRRRDARTRSAGSAPRMAHSMFRPMRVEDPVLRPTMRMASPRPPPRGIPSTGARAGRRTPQRRPGSCRTSLRRLNHAAR